MEVSVSLATTGELVYSTAYSEVNDLRVWELRLHICHELASAKYFSFVLFRGHDLLDDTAMLAEYADSAHEGKLHLQLIVRDLRPPTDEERRAIINGIELRHRSFLWSIMSRGVQMTSTIPAGTARDSTLIRAITTRPFPEYDVGPLPDIVTTLLLAMCDPNDQGAPPRSTLEVAIRRNDASLLELLLQYRADPQLREEGQELPIIVAASRGALSCVQILLAYGADPCATEQVPSADLTGPRPRVVRRKTAVEVASTCPAIVEALQTAITAAHVRTRPVVETADTSDNL